MVFLMYKWLACNQAKNVFADAQAHANIANYFMVTLKSHLSYHLTETYLPTPPQGVFSKVVVPSRLSDEDCGRLGLQHVQPIVWRANKNMHSSWSLLIDRNSIFHRWFDNAEVIQVTGGRRPFDQALRNFSFLLIFVCRLSFSISISHFLSIFFLSLPSLFLFPFFFLLSLVHFPPPPLLRMHIGTDTHIHKITFIYWKYFVSFTFNTFFDDVVASDTNSLPDAFHFHFGILCVLTLKQKKVESNVSFVVVMEI